MSIINRNHGFIFLKSHKTASSSIENFLIASTPLGNDIYYTSKEILQMGFPRASKNYTLFPGQSKYWFSQNDLAKQVRDKIWGGSRLIASVGQHDTTVRLRYLIGDKFWENAYKVIPVRNPWDALVSYYEWFASGREGRSEKLHTPWEE
jgi:hypothetical protein